RSVRGLEARPGGHRGLDGAWPALLPGKIGLGSAYARRVSRRAFLPTRRSHRARARDPRKHGAARIRIERSRAALANLDGKPGDPLPRRAVSVSGAVVKDENLRFPGKLRG